MPLGSFRINSIAKRFAVTVTAEVIRRKVGITAVNQTQISTAQSQFGGASAVFDGNDDHLLLNSLPSITGDCTIELWGRFDILPWNQTLGGGSYMMVYTGNATNYWMINRSGTGSQVNFQIATDNKYGSFTKSGVNLAINTWYHIAIVRSAGVWKAFFNGTELNTFTNDSGFTNSGRTENVAFGTIGKFIDSRGSWDGFMDEFRVSNTARYSADFTPSTAPFTNDANTLFLMHANGTNASTFFEDDNGVRTPKGISAVGNAQISTAQSQFGGASALFDGSGDFLQVAYQPDLRFGTNDFTFECWYRPIARSQDFPVIFGVGTGFSPGIWSLHDRHSNSNTRFQLWNYNLNASAAVLTSNTTVTNGTWYHLALVRVGTSIRLYINGTLDVSTTSSANWDSGDSSSPFYVSRDGSTCINGYVDELRVSNIARYTSNFTAPTAPHVNDANTQLLIHADGTNNSTVFTDDNGVRSQKGISAFGNAQISTAQSKFGGASALFDAADDYIIVQPNSDLAHGTGDFTIEFWIRFTSTASSIIYDARPLGGGSTQPVVYWASSTVIYFVGANRITSSSLSLNTWYHISVSRSGTSTKMFLDGTQTGVTYTDTTNYTIGANRPVIGTTGDGAPGGGFNSINGWMDEIRISNTARYTANFTPSTTPFQNDANTLLLIHADGTNNSNVFRDDNGVTSVAPAAQGGEISFATISGVNYKVHKFITNSNFIVNEPIEVEYLVVGGGGGSGGGGGGGAGGLIHNVGGTKLSLSPQTYAINIGLGGPNGSSNTNGQDTTALGLTAIGGGRSPGGSNGTSGGSGGGAALSSNARTGGAALQPTSASGGFGNAGGNNISGNGGMGSGGGAGAAGTTNAAGGIGLQVNIDGSNSYYAGGGGAFNLTTGGAARAGGLGGGGAGAVQSGAVAGSGTPNTGGGAGGGFDAGPTGGSGVVIIRYVI